MSGELPELRQHDAPRILEELLLVAEAHGVTHVRVEWSGVAVEFDRVPLAAPGVGAPEEAPREPTEYEQALKREVAGGKDRKR